jgi:hypothetical protein
VLKNGGFGKFKGGNSMKKFLSIALALAMTLSLAVVGASATEYKDLTDKASIKHTEAVTVMNKIGIISGYSDGSFKPAASITRGAAAKIICMAKLGTTTANSLSTEAAPFKDVSTANTFAAFIAYCSNTKVVNGYNDGSFRPSESVTGYAFAKMLLTAIGVTGTYTGNGWEVNVAAAAQKAGLFDGIDGIGTTVFMNKPLSRDNACQMAFNAMNYTANGGTTLYTVKNAAGTTTLYSGTDAITALLMKQADATNTLTATTTNTGSLGDTVYGLESTTVTDDFGRPTTSYTATGWTSALTFAKTPVLTYKGAVKLTTLYTALGLTANKAITTEYNNGNSTTVPAQTISKSTTLVTGSGNGSITEVYKNAKGELTVVTVQTYAATVSKVTAAKAETETTVATDRTVTLKSAAVADIDGKTFATTSFAKDDVVLVTYTNATADPSKAVIESVTAATKVTGQVTKTTSAGVYTVGGKDYQMSANKTSAATTNVVVGNTVDMYLDAQGNIIDAALVSSNATTYYGFALEYNRVIHADAKLGTAATETSEQVKFVDSTGATKTLSTTAAYNSSTKSNNFVGEAFVTVASPENSAYSAPKALFAYTLDSNGKIASISVANTTALTDASVAAGQKYVTTGTNVKNYLTDSTPVFYYDGTNVTVYTGASKVIAKTITTADSYVMNPTAGVASAVLLKVASVTPATASKYVYINDVTAKTVETTATAAGTTTSTTLTDVYLDGVAGKLVVDNALQDTAAAALAAKTLYKYTVTDGVAALTKVTPADATVSLIQSGYFVAGSNVVLTGTATKYVQVNTDGTVEVATSMPTLASLSGTSTHLSIIYTDGDASTTAGVVYFSVVAG